MKILYISGDIGIAVGGRKGASTHIREACNALARYGHEVKIITPNPGDLSLVNVPVIHVPAPKAKWLGSDVRYLILNQRIKKVIKQEFNSWKPDAVYERYSLYQSAGLEMCTKYNIPRILEVNTLLVKELGHRLHFPQIAQRIENAIWRREKAIICVSSNLKQLMTQSARLEESKMVEFMINTNSVDPKVFHPSVSPDTEILKIAEGKKIAGYTGTLTAWHGIDLLFDTARILQSNNSNIKMIIVGGDTVKLDPLREKTRELGLEDTLHFYGSVSHDRIPPIIASFDMCIIPDTQDWSSPSKFFEFGAMAKPIIAAGAPSVYEVFGKSNTSGYIFERNNARDMAEKMTEIATNNDLARSLGENARKRILENYTWNSTIRNMMNLYKKLGAKNTQIPPQETY